MKILLWFAWKFVPSWYQQQRVDMLRLYCYSCDLLENSYLCGISNNNRHSNGLYLIVVICLKIRTFVVSATTINRILTEMHLLWFAWKFVPLWYQQQRKFLTSIAARRCDLLENSYLCGISNNTEELSSSERVVVICLKIRTFVVSATTR